MILIDVFDSYIQFKVALGVVLGAVFHSPSLTILLYKHSININWISVIEVYGTFSYVKKPMYLGRH